MSGISSYTPMSDENWGTDAQIAGKADIKYGRSVLPTCEPRVFRFRRHAYRAGPQTSRRADVPGSPTVAVVNESFVKKFFEPGEKSDWRALGEPDPGKVHDFEIVGVVGRHRVFVGSLGPSRDVFHAAHTRSCERHPPAQGRHFAFSNSLTIATESPMPELETQARDTLRGINPNLALSHFTTFSRQIVNNTSQDRMIQRLTMIFGGLSLLLAGDWPVTA